MQSGTRGRGAVKPREPRARRACHRSVIRRVATCTRKPELQRRLHLKLVSLCLDKCRDMLSDKGVRRLTAGIWTGMTASQRNEKWVELLSNGFWRKLSGKRQEFAILVLRFRQGFREVLGETHRVDSVLRASECVNFCAECSDV